MTQPTPDMTAVALGVAIDASDERGAPRLIRAVVPRASAVGATSEQAAREHLTVLAPLWISRQRAADLTAHGVQHLRNGASIVRLRQQIDSVDIHQSELRVMLHPDGSLGAVAGTLRPSTGRPQFQSTATAAVDHALDALAGSARPRPAITEAGARDGYQQVTVAPTPELRVQSARVRRELLPEGGTLRSIWSVELMAERAGFDGRVEPAARRYLIADVDGSVLREVNLTANDSFVYRVFADPTGNRTPLDGALDSYTPHPTGIPDDSMPGLASQNLVVMEAFNGPRDPWLGPAATTTSGNNVDAFADIAPPTGFGTGDIRPQVRAGRTLNYRYDFAAEPLATPTQSMAAAVNVFYVTNWLHDWYYDSGFTEASGNAQLDNYGRGGIGGDPLIAHAQSEALVGTRNNAQMTTPEDGASPIMDMFLWSGGPITSLTTPTATPNTAAFISGPENFDVTGDLILAQNASNAGHDGCGGITDTVRGKLVLVKFTGSCSTREVVNNVAFRGASGIVMMIAIPGEVASQLTGSASANLPGLVVGYTDGLALEAELPAIITMHRETKIANDGDFDNAIVAHEWGHYMHLRLTSCEAFQCFAMSEGWGDFMALHMMLRETDNRNGTFGMGLYALAAGGISAFNIDPGYFGIRRFPYSIDRAANALSFRHIAPDAPLPETPINPGPVFAGNSEVHNAGEIWATMLWEAYNVLIDQHGYAEARRRMSDYAVGGMLLTPPDATYTEARDAMLAAAGALDTDDMLLIAAAFAGRGAGSCAVSADRNARFFFGVVESGTLAARIQTTTPTLTDDGTSCDHDGHLDPGETGMLRITIANSGIVAAEDVVVKATTTAPGVTLGKPVVIANLAALSQVDVQIPVQVSTSAPTRTNLDIAVAIDGNAGCNTSHLALALHHVMGVDESDTATATADFEMPNLGWTPTGSPGLWSRATDSTGNHVLFGLDSAFPVDGQLVSPVLQVSTTQPLIITLQHAYAFEGSLADQRFYDGGLIEVSSDAGATWRDVTELGADPGYPATLMFTNPLSGRAAFSAMSPGYPQRRPLVLDFGTHLAGQAVQLRLRIATDICCTDTGWEIDDIAVSGITNTPFPGMLPEPTRCGVRERASMEGGVTAVRSMPWASLDGVAGVSSPL